MHRQHVNLRLVRAPLLAAGAAVAFIGSLHADAQDTAHELRAALAECAAHTRSRDRLACYDELAGAPRPAAEASSAQSAPPAVEAFGLPDTAPAPQAQAAQAPAELHSSVAALREVLPGMLEITLENGQVWRQTGSDRYPLRVGYDVRVYRARFGGEYFRLTAPTLRGFVQVERVR